MIDLKRGEHGELVIEIGGTFDGKAATRLAGWLVEVPAGDDLVLDFTRVRDCQDFSLASVARDLAARGARLQVRGLTRHQERMLRYFGVDLDRLPVELRGDEDALG
jgi:hypothetical protein